MTAGAANWVWANSRAANGSLIVLLAIAHECGNGGEVEMSVTELARKTRLSDRGVRSAVKELERLGELSVTPRRGGVSRYAIAVTPADSAGPTPADIAGGADSAGPPTPAESAGPKPDTSQVSDPTPAEFAGPEIPNALKGSVVSGRRSKPSTSEVPREDVERLCKHLADRIVANGSRPPSITRRWRDSARLLMDKDGMTEKQVHDAIDWSQEHHFWHRNILSMEKLRQQYDKLRLDAIAEREKKARPASNGHQPTTEDFDALRENWARPLDQETGNDTRGNDRPGGVHRDRLPAAEDKPGISGRLV